MSVSSLTRLFHNSLAVAALGLVAGCADDVDGGAAGSFDLSGEEAENQRSVSAAVHGYVRVEQGLEFGQQGAPEGKAYASALFARSNGSQRAVARVLGAADELPESTGCQQIDANREGLALRTLLPVELLPVTGVRLSAGDTTVDLQPRAYPDVANLVSGVTYTTPSTRAAAFPHKNPLEIHIQGLGEVANGKLSVDVPATPTGVSINGADLSAFARAENAPESGQLDIRWQPSKDAQDSDVVIVEIDGSQGKQWRCTDGGTGRVTLRADQLSQAGQLRVRLERVRHASWEGLDVRSTSFASTHWAQ